MKSKQKSERTTAFAKGGAGKMFPKQTAGPQRPGSTAHAVKGGASKHASGGPKLRGHSVAKPAAPGRRDEVTCRGFTFDED